MVRALVALALARQILMYEKDNLTGGYSAHVNHDAR